MKTKTAGIITYWDTNDNYGTILQNYAVQKVCKKYGIEPILIRTDFSKSYTIKEKIIRDIKCNGLFYTLKKSVQTVFKISYLRLCTIINQKRKFSDFCEQYKNQTEKVYTSIKNLESSLPPKDIYIVGSDQVWNISSVSSADSRTQDYIRGVFLDFVPENAKKISCAVSFGTNCFNYDFKDIVCSLIKKFDFISVREKSGIRICKELGYDGAIYHFDPTLLLDKTDYENLFDNSYILPKQKYVLLYLLNNQSKFSLSKFYDWAKKRSLQVVYVNGNLITPKINFRRKNYATIPQWLKLIAEAECIFTNSFHGTVFSIIFNKKFLTILQTKNFEKQNERVLSFLNDLSLKKRLLFDIFDFDKVFETIDYNNINNVLSKKKEQSEFCMYLCKMMEDGRVNI